MKKKGKLIVIDGIDGSGKATQVALLKESFQKKKLKVKTIDFPRYYENFFGSLIGEYLSGKHGNFLKVDPRLSSLLYAADRFESKKKIEKWLQEGYFVIADRYVSANQIHQGGKIKNLKERKEFLKWLDKMEYDLFGLPRPDLVIYLDVPFAISKQWLLKKSAKNKKKYLKGKKDIVEDSASYLKSSRSSALYLEKNNKNWSKVVCCRGRICMSAPQVHEQVFSLLQKRMKI